MVTPGLSLLAISFVGADKWVVTALLFTAMFGYGLNTGGETPIIADFAPDFGGHIYGLANTVSSLTGVLAPLIIGALLDAGGDTTDPATSWSWVFYLSVGLFGFATIVFNVWTTAEQQPWGLSARTQLITN